jgi:hypothetical protein
MLGCTSTGVQSKDDEQKDFSTAPFAAFFVAIKKNSGLSTTPK